MTSQLESLSASVTTSTPDDTSDSNVGGESTKSQNWWQNAVSASQRTVSNQERPDVFKTSLGGRICLITCEEHPASTIEMCHLIPKSTKGPEIAKLQYAFGRKLNPNCRWFNFYLRSDLHRSFDHATDPGWVLLPTRELAFEINHKISDLLERRRQEGTVGAWPDFRSRDWFPAKRGGYDYEFIPLSMATNNTVICRRSGPGVTHTLYYPPFRNMPLLRSHVHPYAVIVNAGKKLATAGMARTSHIPADLLLNVIMIYTTLTEAHQTARSNSLSVQNDYSRRRSPSDTDTAANDAATGTSRDPPRRSPVIRNEDSSTQTTGANDSPLRDFDDLFDNFDDELHEMADDFGYLSRDTLSVSTPNGLGASISKTFIVDRCWSFQNSKRQNCVEWMIEVELARQQSELINPPDEESLHTRMYRSEPPRPPPTKNWHSWTSEFAPWWVVLPEPKDRGVVSSNDWAEIKNFPPLTRKLAP